MQNVSTPLFLLFYKAILQTADKMGFSKSFDSKSFACEIILL